MSGSVRAVLFDLDDTLYPEMQFVRGGFRAVAAWLSPRLGADADALLAEMLTALEVDGRGRVFDSLLATREAWSAERARACLWAYRTHRPSLRLYEDVTPALARLREQGVRLGIITDGMGAVQQAKVDALGLRAMVDTVVCTDLLGPDAAKPSGLPYRVALDDLGVAAAEAAYVGDNPRKDFLWPNANGMTSVHIRRTGSPPDPIGLPAGAHARHEVATLADLSSILSAVTRAIP